MAPTNNSASPVVAVILKGYPRLSETFIAQELRGLEVRGLRLVFYAMRYPTDKKTHPIHDEITAPVFYLPEYLHREPLRVLRSIWALRSWPTFWPTVRTWLADLRRDPTPNRVRRFGQACVLAAEMPQNVDRLYAHFIHTPGSVTRYASQLRKLPWSCSAHAKDIWTSPDWDLKLKLTSATWVATCTRVGHTHLANLADRPDDVHLIYHGLDLSRFPSPQTRQDRRLRDGRDPQDPVQLLCVGRAVEKKGIDTLLHALARLPRDLNWRFTHIGGGALAKRLKRESESLGLADRVTWRGALAQEEVLATYRNCDLFVLPCRIAADGDRDGLPNVLVEAQSQALACISTPVSAIPELIRDGKTGHLVPPNDPEELATAIVELSRDPERRNRLAQAGEARVRSTFDMTAGLDTLAQLFPSDLRTADVSTTDAHVVAEQRLPEPAK
ncbi:MAG: glycosyltransferase family 4 protein [Pseudomonadota bacterium]